MKRRLTPAEYAAQLSKARENPVTGRQRIERTITKTTRASKVILTGLSLLVAAFAFVLVFALDKANVLTLFGVVAAAAFGVLYAWRIAQRCRVVLDRPEEIVWIYIEQTDATVIGLTILPAVALKVIVGLTNNKKMELIPTIEDPWIRDDSPAEALIEALLEIVPFAHFGYSKQVREMFRSNPKSLLRDEQQS